MQPERTSAPNGNGHPKAPAVAPVEAPAPPTARSPRKPLLVLGTVAMIVIGSIVVHAVLTAGRESTDDAQIEADVIPIAPRVGGAVLHVRVRDNQAVHAGEILAELDTTEYAARVAQAEAEVDTQRAQADAADADARLTEATAGGNLRVARAGVSSAGDSVRTASAQVAEAIAGLARAEAQARLTASSVQRTRALRATGAISQAEQDNAQSLDDAAQAALTEAHARVSMAQAGLHVAQSHVGEAEGRLDTSAPVDVEIAAAHARAALAHARARSAEAALTLARAQLSWTTVTAPVDGVVSRLSVHEGQLVQPTQAIAELVPRGVYLVASFKETEVGEMRPGQRADFTIDAFPGRTFVGRVDSLSGGTGARFSLIPPDNASGNFVKVVQRVPVRITWEHPPMDLPLAAGLSADVTVHTR